MIDERRQTSLLGRMFFGRLFESELMPAGLPQIQLLVWVVAFLAAPSALAPILLSKKYVWLSGLPLHTTMEQDRAMALLLSMVATGLITLVIWENVFPDRRDGRILGVLPVRTRTFVMARLLALLALFSLLVVAMTLFSSVSFGLVNLVFAGPGGFVRRTASHFIAAAGLEATVFFGIIALQCALLNTVGAAVAHRLAVVLQAALVVGLLQLPLLMSMLDLPRAPAWGPVAGLATAVTALGLYVGSYRRMVRLALEGTGVSSARRRRLAEMVPAAARLTAASPAARAVCAFTLRTVVRSRQHRMILAAWLGLAVAIAASGIVPLLVADGWRAFDRPRTAVLAAPLVFAALIMAGVRMLFAVPSEIRANWTIKSRQPIPVRHALDGAAAALVVCVIPPVLFAWISATLLWGVRVGAIHAVVCALLGILLAQLLALGLDKVPFTCTYVPGKAKFVKLWPLYLTGFSSYTYTMAGLEAELLARGGIGKMIGILLVLTIVAAYLRHRRASEVGDLRFEEELADTLTVLTVR